MSSLYEDEEALKKHCELQWKSKFYMAKYTMEGSEEEKERVLNQRIKKFHLYNTPQLQFHAKNQMALSTSISQQSSIQTIDFESYEKSLVLIGVLPTDINYLGILFREYNIQIKEVVTLPQNQGLQLYFRCPFERVEQCILKVNNTNPVLQKNADGVEWYKLKQLEGFDIVNPRVRARILMEPKPGSNQYLYETARVRFIENETSRMEIERRSRSRSRSRLSFRSSSRQSSASRSIKSQAVSLLESRKPRVLRNRNRGQNPERPRDCKVFPRQSFRVSMHHNRLEIQRKLA